MSICSVERNLSFNLQSIILPTDIAFKIISEDDKERVVVKAHRNVLCLQSPVFKAYLSEGGCWHNAGSQILIKDISWKPFQTMIDFFYKKSFIICDEYDNIEELFEILEVADRYQVESLVDLCKKSLLSFPMELKSVIQIANTAKYYKNLTPFANMSIHLLEKVLNFLESKLQTAADILNFIWQSDTENKALEDSIKLELLRNLARRKCDKCGLNVSNKVFRETTVVGAWLDVSKRSNVGEQGKLRRVPDTEYSIAWEMKTQAYDVTYEICRDLHDTLEKEIDTLEKEMKGELGKIAGFEDINETREWNKENLPLMYQRSRDFHVPIRIICKCDI